MTSQGGRQGSGSLLEWLCDCCPALPLPGSSFPVCESVDADKYPRHRYESSGAPSSLRLL